MTDWARVGGGVLEVIKMIDPFGLVVRESGSELVEWYPDCTEEGVDMVISSFDVSLSGFLIVLVFSFYVVLHQSLQE